MLELFSAVGMLLQVFKAAGIPFNPVNEKFAHSQICCCARAAIVRQIKAGCILDLLAFRIPADFQFSAMPTVRCRFPTELMKTAVGS